MIVVAQRPACTYEHTHNMNIVMARGPASLGQKPDIGTYVRTYVDTATKAAKCLTVLGSMVAHCITSAISTCPYCK